MTARRRHGAGPPNRGDDRAGSGPSKSEYRRLGTARRRDAAALLTANPESRRVPDAACGKTRYASAAAAESALAVIIRFGDCAGRYPVRTYACPVCRGWHLTSWPAAHTPPPL